MRWERVLAAVRQRRLDGAVITGVTEDSRRVRPGMIFVARRGFHVDGHDLLAQAREAGATLTVGDRLLGPGLPDVVVPCSDHALADLVSAWHGDPGRHLVMAGVTGTNGKTTTTHLLASILRAAGFAVGSVGSVGYSFASERLPAEHTTPPPEVLYELLARWRAAGATHAAVEVSAQALSQGRVAACRFSVAALTGFSRDHGEYYADATAYLQAKLSLFRALPSHGVAVLPAADPHLAAFQAAAAGRRSVLYGPDGEVRVLDMHPAGAAGTSLRLRLGAQGARQLRLPLPGWHNVHNALCAAAAALVLGVQADAIAAGLEATPPVPGRGTLLRDTAGRLVLIDYAHNPEALRAVLRLARELAPGRVHAVLGPRGQRDRGKRPLMGAVLAALADTATITCDRPAGEDPRQAAQSMVQAARDCGLHVRFLPDRAAALSAATAALEPGDCLVVTGKGMEPWLGDGSFDGTTDMDVLTRHLPGLAPAPATIEDARHGGAWWREGRQAGPIQRTATGL